MESWMRKVLAPKNMFFCTQYVSFKHTFHCRTYEYKKYYIFTSTDSDKQTMTMRMSGKKSHRFSFVFFHIFFSFCSFKDWWCFCFTTHLSANLCLREMFFFLLLSCHAHKKGEEKCWKKFMTLCSLHCDSYDT